MFSKKKKVGYQPTKEALELAQRLSLVYPIEIPIDEAGIIENKKRTRIWWRKFLVGALIATCSIAYAIAHAMHKI
ncbi:MAG: hypothetical protein WCG55_01345 [bacterium]